MRALRLHEYQAREILQGYDTHVPRSITIFDAEEAEGAFLRLGQPKVILKVQILAGGRGKAGGVKIASSPAEAEDFARRLLGTRLVTPQTTQEGEEVKAVLLQGLVPIERELYLAFVVDRQGACPLLIGCREGGVDIEELTRKSPEKVFKQPWDSLMGLLPFQARKMARLLGLSGPYLREATGLILNLSRAFTEKDLTLLEVNPLAVTPESTLGGLAILDVKANFDDNAFFRHPEMVALRPKPEESLESLASSFGLSYVGLEGDIGCLVNGAGLAMATNDIIRVCGGRPANFLDVGGDASTERVTRAFSILLRDPRLRAVFVNIFGGITRCDTIAKAILEALKDTPPRIPMIVRMEGTNASEARRMLEGSGFPFQFSREMKESTLMAIRLRRTKTE